MSRRSRLTILGTALVTILPYLAAVFPGLVDAFQPGSPLEGMDPVTSRAIMSAFDRFHETPYTRDGRIQAYSGEIGQKSFGVTDDDCYKKQTGGVFILSGNYVGARGQTYLCYDGHPGVDFKANDNWVVAVEAGTVTAVVTNRSDDPDTSCACLGNYVEITHTNGFRSRYGHLKGGTGVLVALNERVLKGQRIARSGNSGVSYGPHLHLEFWSPDGRKIDPFSDFRGIGDLPGGGFESVAAAVSAKGEIVVGQGQAVGGRRAVRWTQDGGMESLGTLAGGSESSSTAVSADGGVVVGGSGSANGFRAFRWTKSGGMVGLNDPAGVQESYATGVSADGDVVVGGKYGGRYEAFRWTSGGGMVGLGFLPGGRLGSVANAVSADGKVVVGSSDSSLGVQAFRWTAAGGMVGLGDLPGGAFNSMATATSARGNVVVGYGTSRNGTQAFRWTASGGMIGLGELAGGDYFSYASSVSGDGRIVVGQSASSAGYGPFVWDSLNGMRSLKDVLQAQYSSAIIGWNLNWALGISDDGTKLVGVGLNPAGQAEAWIVTLP